MWIWQVIYHGVVKFRGTFSQCEEWIKGVNHPVLREQYEIKIFKTIG